jgi:MFS transporter, DHA2 family, multidrug resistance protein
MAALTSAVPLSEPAQQVRALAATAPSELSQSPLLGILGVISGAGIVTLTGRMITVGLPDLKGHLGISFDEGAWISSTYNIALMFMGPLTVYLGGLFGPRRILLVSATGFTLVCGLLPFVHSYSLLIGALVLAGLTSGTFYPLTLTFALRNIPLRFLPFTLAFYATFVDMGVNIAPTLYGWYRDHLSWHWMFWNSALITPLMIACIYWGIPASPTPKRSSAAPSFAGLLYASAAFGMLFAVLDQGERLDWWRSGTITALATGGGLLLLATMLQRLRGPNPLVDLQFLLRGNTLLSGSALILFRFCLLATIVLVPQSLSIHGFEADQIGPAVVWVAVPQLAVACVAALLLLRKIDPRLLMAIGFACMAFAACLNASYTGSWAAENYYGSELLMAAGQSFAFIGLVGSIVLNGVVSGAMAKPPTVLTYSAYFHLVRLLGGELGVSFMTHFIAVREKLHSNLIGLHVQNGSWIADGNIHGLAAGLFSKSSGVAAASGRAIGLVDSRIRLQAYTLTFIDGFYLIAGACVLAMLVIALMRRFPINYGDLGSFQEMQASQQDGEK